MVTLINAKAVDLQPFRHLYPFKSHFLSINGWRYHYLEEGRGRPLVMVHGNPTWSFFFRNLVAALRDDHRIIVPDHLGCGLSDKPTLDGYDFRLHSRVFDLDALLTHTLGDQPLTLIVHDWGGMIGLAWAMDHLPQVRRMVIMNTAGFFPPRHHPIPLRLRLIRRPNPIMDRAVLWGNLFARAALHMAVSRPLAEDVKAGLIAPYNCPRHRLATLKFVQDIPLSSSDPSGPIVQRVSDNLHHLRQIPVLLLWGAKDFVFSKVYFEEWRRRLPLAQHHWLADAGHYLLEDKPDQVIELISRFLQRHPIQ